MSLLEKCDGGEGKNEEGHIEGEVEEQDGQQWLRNKTEVKKKLKKSQLFHFSGCLKLARKIGNSGVP